MSRQEEEFLQRLRATFKVEAEEHVQAMSAGLLALEKAPVADGNSETLEAVFRHAHSLKGAARATNIGEVEAICQSLEDVFSSWRRREIVPAADHFDALHQAVDLIGSLVGASESGLPSDSGTRVSAVVRQLGLLAPGARAGRPARPVSVPAVLRSSGEDVAAVPVATSAEAPRAAFAETLRVSAPKLDALLLQAEEMLAVKQTASQRAADLRQFEALFAEWTKRWGQVQGQLRALTAVSAAAERDEGRAPVRREGDASFAALLEFFDWNQGHVRSLEGRILSLAKAAAQDQHAIGKHVDDLLADSKKLLMLPFSTISDLLPKLVRDLSRDQGKEADLVIRGKEVEMDKRILEEMKDPLIHLVRNCIDHGIEAQGRGLRPTKATRATITIAVEPVNGSKIEIVVADDGAGIDLERVRKSAVRRGVITAEEARELDDGRALDLIFLSEVSTSPIITEISGRGLGLAIVREKTEKLGGRVAVESRPQGGTTFRISLPLTLATFRGILVRTGDHALVIPTSQVNRVARVSHTAIRTVENREAISLDGRAVSYVALADVLELDRAPRTAKAAGFVQVVVLGSGDRQIAFGVDEVLRDEEVLVKTLGRPLLRVRNIAGATLLASGKVAPILNAADLMKSARSGGFRPRSPAGAGPEPNAARKAKSVLLAEDSITSRMLLKGILEAAGYRVRTAVDGVDALTALRTDDFDLVVSDVEMPRLNGFDLTAQIRADKRLAEMPVVLVTALSSTADRERGVEAGANAYIVKSSFDQSNLLEVVRRLAG